MDERHKNGIGNRSNDPQPGEMYYEKPIFVHSTWNEPLTTMTEEQLAQVMKNILMERIFQYKYLMLGFGQCRILWRRLARHFGEIGLYKGLGS